MDRMRAYVERLHRFWWLVCLVWAAVAGAALWQVKHLKKENSLEAMLPEDDPPLRFYHEMRDRFASDEIMLIAWEEASLFSNDAIVRIRGLTEQLRALPEVEWLTSLTQSKTVHATEDAVDIRPLFDAADEIYPPAVLDRARARALGDPLLVKSVVSPDGKVTAICLGLSPPEDPDARPAFVALVGEILHRAGLERDDYWLAGVAPVQAAYVRTIERDSRLFLLVAAAALVLILTAVFRSLAGVIIPFVTMGLLVLVTMGAYAASGRTVNSVTLILPPLLMVVSTSAIVHLLSHARAQRVATSREAIVASLGLITWPVLLNVCTSAVGFSSLTVSGIRPVAAFGAFAALGLGFTFLVVMTLAPLLFTTLPMPRLATARGGKRAIVVVLRGCETLALGHRRLVLLGSAALAAGAAFGITQIVVETNLIDYFSPGARIRRDLAHIEASLSGTSSIDVIISTPRGLPNRGEDEALDTILDPVFVRFADEVMRHLDAEEEVLSVHGWPTYLRAMHRAMTSEAGLPERRDLIAQYRLLAEGAESGPLLEHYLDSTGTALRVSARVKHGGAMHGRRLVARLRGWLSARAPEGVAVRVTGLVPIYANMVHTLISGQLRGFGLALMVIAVIMVLLHKSLRLGLVAMVPNVLPVAVTAGLMGIFGFELNTATAMVAGIAIGIAVDDTIHFVTFYRRFRRQGLDAMAAVRGTIHAAGPAMVTTSLVLFAGFGVLCFSGFVPIRIFGALSAITMLSALVGDLIVLPALLVTVDRDARGQEKS